MSFLSNVQSFTLKFLNSIYCNLDLHLLCIKTTIWLIYIIDIFPQHLETYSIHTLAKTVTEECINDWIDGRIGIGQESGKEVEMVIPPRQLKEKCMQCIY